jgi:SAM-dependent methyltransferase
VQRNGKVPIAVAREAKRREVANDHQREYLRLEEASGRVVAAWDLSLLPTLVRAHPAAERRILSERRSPSVAERRDVIATLDLAWASLVENPFREHPTRRYAYAWRRLAGREGRHLDVGVLSSTTNLECWAADPHPGYLAHLRAHWPAVRPKQISIHGPLPFASRSFASVSLLDALERAPDEAALLREIHRVLIPGGILVATVPGRHVFSALDPDNAKFRMPRLHRLVYSARFGRAVYHERFVDLSNDLHGDMSVGKNVHTKYRREQLFALLRSASFDVIDEDGSGLFWRWFDVPALLAGRRRRRLLERAILLDGQMFSSANLFVTAARVG